jgi:hypothetical protein
MTFKARSFHFFSDSGIKISLSVLVCLFLFIESSKAQIDESETGAWYMYFWSAQVKEGPWGFQGDLQYRNWNLMGDLEQLLLRGGLTYKPKNAPILFTLGYAHITTGEYDSSDIVNTESRVYQEALIPHKVGGIFYLRHRFRYEQRWVENQDFRTRFRYNLFLDIPLNSKGIDKKTLYLAFYNELFINGQRDIGDGRSVELFDRNRTYGALGYAFRKNLKVQFGLMRQITDNWAKTQLQLSLHHNW